MRIKVYSAIIGGYDEFIEDGREILTEGDIKVSGLSDNMLAKHPKMMPHVYFPEYEYSIWIDGNMSLKVGADQIVETFLDGVNWAVCVHSDRKGPYEEMVACSKSGRGDPDELRDQIVRYYEAGFPREFGLWENSVIIRRHNEKDVMDFSKVWWEETIRGSERDQISFPYCVWKSGLRFRQIRVNLWDDGNRYFKKESRGHKNEIKLRE